MRQKIILFLKGIIIGAGKIIPGVSGGMLAITLNIYDKGIEAISNFFKDIKKNFTFLFTIGIGILVSILSISKIIKIALNNCYLPTMLLFIGLIIGGVPSVVKEAKQEISIKNIIIMLLPFIFVFLMSMISNKYEINDYAKVNFMSLVGIGVIDAITMIIPGISGTAILMMLGYYNMIIDSFSSLTDVSKFSYNITVILPFLLGVVLGVIVLSRIIDFLLNKYRIKCYYAIIGFTISSILLLLGETLKNNYSIVEILVSIGLLILGCFLTNKMERLN